MSAAALPNDPDAVALVDLLHRATAAAGFGPRVLRHVDDLTIATARVEAVDAAVRAVLAVLARDGAGDLSVLAGLDGDELVVSLSASLSPGVSPLAPEPIGDGMQLTSHRQRDRITYWVAAPMAAGDLSANGPAPALAVSRDPARIGKVLGRVVTVWTAARRGRDDRSTDRSAA